NVERFRQDIRFVEGDLSNPDVAAEAVAGVDRVIHLASIPSVPRSVAHPVDSARSSIIATVSLLDAAVKAGVKRVAQASSSSVYGNTDVSPRVETLPNSPQSPYAVSKMTQEYYAAVFNRCYGLDTVSLRYFNVFGPGQNPNSAYAAVIPKFTTAMMAGERPVIFGDGEQTRDFTFVDNVVEANLAAATAPGPLAGTVVNIGGGGAGVSVNDLVHRLNHLLGTDLAPIYQPPRVGDVLHSSADITRARDLLGYRPTVDFAEGLRRTVETFRTQ
ncbi:MAG: NAD-dependent epimerase/dehydratase family protein, partial [Clostridium sp.]|nr:NAD-dependent epimerase/dehydratase family protein [Clostridium sp.]